MSQTVGNLVIDLRADVARLTNDMREVKSAVASGMQAVQAEVEQLNSSLNSMSSRVLSIAKSFGAITSAAAFGELIEKTIHSAAEIKHLSERTGVAVEALSGLRGVAKLSGTDMEVVAGGMQKLSKVMIEAQAGTGNAAVAFRAIGVSVTDSNGKLKTAEQVTLETAKAFAGFEDGATKTAAAMAIFGKTGANLLPMLNDLAEKGTLNGKITKEQAEAADQFEKDLVRLKGAVAGTFTKIAVDLIPAVTKLAGLFKPAAELAVAYFAIFVAGPAILGAATTALGSMQMMLALTKLELAHGATAWGLFNAAMTGTVVNIGPTFAAMNASLGTFKTAMATMGGVAMAAFAGWEIGKWLSDNFVEARLAGVAFVEATMKGWEYIKYGAQVAWLAIKSVVGGVIADIVNDFAGMVEAIGKGLQAVGAASAAQNQMAFAKGLRESTVGATDFTGGMQKLSAELDTNIANIKDITGELADEAIAHFEAKTGAEAHRKELTGLGKDAEGAAKAFEAMNKSLSAELAKGNAQLSSLRLNRDPAEHVKRAELESQLVNDEKLKTITEEQKNLLRAKADAVDLVTVKVKLMTEATKNHVEAQKAEAEAQAWLTMGSAAASSYAEAIRKLESGGLAHLSIADQQKYMMDALAKSIGEANKALGQYTATSNDAIAKELVATSALLAHGDAAKYNEAETKKLELASSMATDAMKNEAIAAATALDAIKAVTDAIKNGVGQEKANSQDRANGISDATARANALLAIDMKYRRDSLALAKTYYASLSGLSDEQLRKMNINGKAGLQILQDGLKRAEAAMDDHGAIATDKNKLDAQKQAWTDFGDTIGKALSNGFGAGGKALAGLVSSMSDYQKTLLDIQADEKNSIKLAQDRGDQAGVIKAQTDAAAAQAQAQVGHYANMAGAAKGFFQEGSKGYKALEAVEKAFRVAEMAMAVESFVRKIAMTNAVTAAHVTGETTKLASTTATLPATLAVEGTKQQAYGITALASALTAPFPANIPAFAAVAAMLAAIGVAISGGGGSGPDLSKQRQQQAGTGSVLGDSTAKSDSISKSLQIMEKLSDAQLYVQQGMLQSLRTLEASFSGAATQIIKSGVTSASVGAAAAADVGFKKNGLGSLLSGIPLVGGALGGLFGTKKELIDYGLKSWGTNTVGSVATNGFGLATYATTKSTKKFLGITTGTSTNEDVQKLSGEVNKQFGLLVTQTADAVRQAAGILGVSGPAFEAALNSVVLDIGKVSFKDMKPAEIEKQLQTIFSKLADDMAGAAIPQLSTFQKAGEGAFETMSRLVSELATTDNILQMMGKTSQEAFGAVGLASIKAREDLITFSGGLDKLQSNVASYQRDFLTDGERSALQTKQIGSAFASLGLTLPTTAKGFRQLVDATDLSTEAGRKQYAALMSLSPIMKAYLDGLDAQKKQLADTANSIGLGADAIKSGLLDAVRNAKDANEAGTAFADTVITGIENAMYDNAAKQITDIITQGLVNPIVNAVIAGTSVTDAVSSAAIDDMVKKAGLVAQAVGDLLNNPDFKAALDKIHSSMASIGTSFYGARPPSTAKPQDKGGDKPGDTAANDAKSYADYMLQLNRQLADLKAPDDYTKQLSAIINQYEDGKQKLADMHKAGDAAAMSLLNQTKAAQLLALQTQMTADAFNRAINQLQAMQKLAGAQGNNSSALALGAAVAKSTYDNAVSKAAASLGFTDASLAAWLKATNQTLEQAAQSYWGGMSAAQKEAATAAINAKADLIAANRAVYDAQLKIVTDLAAAIDSLQSVSNKVADDIAKVQIDQGKLTESAWLDSQIAASKQHLAKLYGNGADTAELVAEANNLEALTMQRYEAEKTAIGNLTAYAKQLGDYAKSLLTGNLSPLNAVEKLKRAEADYAETLAAANKGDKDAQGKLTQRADVFLNLARDYYASSQGYTDVFNRIQRDMTGAGASTLSNAEQQAQYLSQLAGNATKTLAELSNIKDAAGYLKTNLTSQLQGAQTTLTTMASSLTSLGVTLPELLRGLPSAIAAAMSGAMAPKVVYATQDGGTAASKAPAFPKPIPGFASGGDHAGGIAQVGEHGPELIATGAARVFTAQQTRQILAGPAIDWRQYGRQDNSALVAEVRRLRETNEKLEQRLEAIEQHTADANHQRGEIAVQQLDRLDNTNKTLGQLQTATELA